MKISKLNISLRKDEILKTIEQINVDCLMMLWDVFFFLDDKYSQKHENKFSFCIESTTPNADLSMICEMHKRIKITRSSEANTKFMWIKKNDDNPNEQNKNKNILKNTMRYLLQFDTDKCLFLHAGADRSPIIDQWSNRSHRTNWEPRIYSTFNSRFRRLSMHGGLVAVDRYISKQ